MNQLSTSKLYVIAAASGTGKTSLLRELLAKHSNLALSVSHTTRAKRPKEKNGVDYHFVSPATFKHMIAEDAFIEYAKVHEHYYGTAKTAISQQLATNTDVALEIDWQGAQQIKQLFPDKAVLIFILPPSYQALSDRLHQRGQDKESVITGRLQAARAEISHYQKFNYLVVNNDFTTAVADLSRIIEGHGEHLTVSQQSKKQANLIAELLQSD